LKVSDWLFAAISLGNTLINAPVHPVSVPAIDSAVVATSTLPATVALALDVDHVANVAQAQPMY